MRLPLFISVLLLAAGLSVSAQSFVPVPHQVQYHEGKGLKVSKGVVLLDVMGTAWDDIDFLTLKRKGIPMTVDYGSKVALENGVKQVSGAYKVDVSEEGISVTGYDERGSFYGLRTLKQIVQMDDSGVIPF